MSDPLGAWHIPYEDTPISWADVSGIVVDGFSVTAGVSDTPLGPLPVLLLDFTSSSVPLEHQPPRLMFIAPPDVMTNFRKVVAGACNGAIAAAQNFGKPGG